MGGDEFFIWNDLTGTLALPLSFELNKNGEQ